MERSEVSWDQALNSALLVGCVYEVFALVTKRAPTITTILRKGGKRHPLGKAMLWLWCGYISWHFLEPLED